MGIKIDFTGVAGQQTFEPVPSGKYIVTVSDYRQGKASDAAKNPGADTISWELTIDSTLSGETTVPSRNGGELKVEGRKIWENMTLVEASMWRLKAFLEACGFDVEGEIDFDPDEVIDTQLVVKAGVQKGRKNRETGEEYEPRNNVRSFHSLDEND